MRILMLGNSFTYFHDMPVMLARLTGWEVEAHTRGGAYLAEQLNARTDMGARTMASLENEQWDFVVLQEQSNAPALRFEAFRESAVKLCDIIKSHGAVPVLYATWAYKDGTEKLASVDMTYEEMDKRMHDAYHAAANEGGALVADVGDRFTAMRDLIGLYEDDSYHPSEAGSLIAAMTIAQTIREYTCSKA